MKTSLDAKELKNYSLNTSQNYFERHANLNGSYAILFLGSNVCVYRLQLLHVLGTKPWVIDCRFLLTFTK